MFIDYVTLMLVNIAASFCSLGVFVLRQDADHEPSWAPVFALSGFVALVTGLRMTFTWPLPGPYNMVFGELSVLLGGLLAATAWHLAKGWELKHLATYACFAGITAAVVGLQFLRLGLSQTPGLAGTGFLLAGISGIGSVIWVRKKTKLLRFLGCAVLFASSVIWGWIGYGAYWAHMSQFMKR